MAKNKKGKDPAFLLYSGDFLSGTYTMNYVQRGKFITLMCIQHQKGFLTEGDMKSVLTEEDYVLFEKFYKDSDGKYYNEKMTAVIEERKTFTESRRLNGLKGGRPKKETEEEANENHMKTKEKPNGYHMLTYKKPNENLLEDEDEDENLDKDQDRNEIENRDVSRVGTVEIEYEHGNRSAVGNESVYQYSSEHDPSAFDDLIK
jgi:hypothetical protein